MKKFIASFVLTTLLSQLCLIPHGFAETSLPLLDGYDTMTDKEKKSVDQIISICSDKTQTELVKRPDGYSSVVAYIKSKEGAQPSVINCEMAGIGPYKITAKDVQVQNGCKVATIENQFKPQTKALEDLYYDARMKRCEKTGTSILSSQCAKELGCNIARSMITAVTGGIANLIADKMKSAKNEQGCLNMTKSNCLGSAVKGILDAIWGMFVELPKEAAKLIAKGASAVWEWASSPWSTKTEKTATQRMVIGSRTSDSQLSEFLADPVGFIKNSLSNLMQTLMDKMGALKREASLSWKCATCDGILNGMCEIVGSFGAPLILSVVTGTVGGYVAKLATNSDNITNIAKIFKKMNEVAEAAEHSKVGSFMKEGVDRIGRGYKFVMDAGDSIKEGLVELASKKIPKLKKFISETEEKFFENFLSKDHYAAYKVRKEVSDQIEKDVLGPLTEKHIHVSSEAKGFIMENPEFFKNITTKEQFTSRLNSLKNTEANFEGTLTEIRAIGDTGDVNGALKAAKKAAKNEIRDAEKSIESLKNKQPPLTDVEADALLDAAKERAESYLRNGTGLTTKDGFALIIRQVDTEIDLVEGMVITAKGSKSLFKGLRETKELVNRYEGKDKEKQELQEGAEAIEGKEVAD